MLRNLLTSSLPEGYQEISLGTAALYALLGFLVVFAGIAFLVLVVWGIGKGMSKKNGVAKAKEVAPEKKEVTKPEPIIKTEEISEETVAVITAALMAYYEKQNPKCAFTVKRIKRI